MVGYVFPVILAHRRWRDKPSSLKLSSHQEGSQGITALAHKPSSPESSAGVWLRHPSFPAAFHRELT
ncbi:hypothetical protein E2562_008452 [Oryza meyeriana var. granulata]|uniref:Uncharacterized protein n=1 Tax=Oryza meyeriana var. granulata TaxID=110450 RepID=A0A6G1EGD3_9ORYZ|nr:hypothetical protein E2562_008452 [Oryza meyeriana var. granulata]